jgi:hypothetical protein
LPDNAARSSIENKNLGERSHRWCQALRRRTPHSGNPLSFRSRFVRSALISSAISLFLAGPLALADPAPRSFVGNFIGYDADPENTFTIAGGVDRAQNFESVYLEKTISQASSLSLFGGYQRFEQVGEDQAASGFTNLDVAYKHVLVSLPKNEFLCSINPTLELPVGDPGVAETHPRGGGDVLFQKGLGDLPESFAMLQPIGIEGGAGWDSKITGARDDLVSVDLELEYSLHYLDQRAAGSVPMLIRDLTPHLDFDYAQYLSAHRNSSAPDFELTPAVAWMNDTYEVNLGAQVGVNHASASTGRVAFVWQLTLTYDQLVPALGWTPLR